ncbi:MAG: sigma-70 family RNA polymerase sigma factor [Saprospiraceae bacterium]|nr:sigma-70 family RNA polymerase sigma factor [Saprospiraceae bacterium]
MSDQFSDEEIVRMIQMEGEERMLALKMLFLDRKVRGGIRAIMKEERVTFEFDDLLQDTFIIFDRNIRNNRFQAKSSIRTYLIGIAKWLMVGRMRKRGEVVVGDIPDELYELPNWFIPDLQDERLLIIRKLIGQMGDRCQQLLRLWSEEIEMKQIAKALKIKDAQAAKKEAYRCRERLKRLFHESDTNNKL